MLMASRLSQSTVCARAAIGSDAQFGAVAPPLYLSSNFTFAELGVPRDYDYTRSGNPTRDAFGQCVAELEGGCGGVVTSSGMSAVALVLELLEHGDTIVVPHDCYGGSHRLFTALSARGRFNIHWVDMSDEVALARAIAERPRLVWVETPSNPLLRVTDIELVARLCRTNGALLAVDNTFLSPALQRPIALGADLVVHSTTKYLNGHSDVVGGLVIARDRDLFHKLEYWANCLGTTGAPFDSYMALRGLRTLPVRMRQHEENASAIAHYLEGHDRVRAIHYPGLEAHDGHRLATRQQSGFGAMMSVELDMGFAALGRFVGALRCFSLAESLGGVESLICHPTTMTHASMTPEDREHAGISESLIRLSIGIEGVDDLIGDLEQALREARAASGDRNLVDLGGCTAGAYNGASGAPGGFALRSPTLLHSDD
jgi:cystathionine gamma-synthase